MLLKPSLFKRSTTCCRYPNTHIHCAPSLAGLGAQHYSDAREIIPSSPSMAPSRRPCVTTCTMDFYGPWGTFGIKVQYDPALSDYSREGFRPCGAGREGGDGSQQNSCGRPMHKWYRNGFYQTSSQWGCSFSRSPLMCALDLSLVL